MKFSRIAVWLVSGATVIVLVVALNEFGAKSEPKTQVVAVAPGRDSPDANVGPTQPASPSQAVPEVIRQPDVSAFTLGAAVRQGFASENYRALVQNALVTKTPLAVRVAMEVESYCGLLRLVSSNPRLSMQRMDAALLQEKRWRERACAASGGIDPQQTRALLRLRESLLSAPEFAVYRVTGQQAEIRELDDLEDGAGIASWGSHAAKKARALVAGDSQLLQEAPDVVVSLAWQVAVCRVYECDELLARLGNCFDESTCQMSLEQLLARSAISTGVSLEQWNAMVDAMGGRLKVLFPSAQRRS